MRVTVWVLAAIISLLLPLQAHAETYQLYSDNVTGDGAAANVSKKDFKFWTCDMALSGDVSNTTAVSVGITGNTCSPIDCSPSELDTYSPTWVALYSLTPTEIAGKMASITIINVPLRRIRASLVTLTTASGPTPRVTIRCMGVQ